ncbi:energy-coupling factor transport system ATP-binding protein [Pullulanibacillus pueri]|uniref:Energy-coupling factor transporter ATP-binding protein EcfA2 n=1 Tax=Pullulanibacillus pueri TaxID=1437324 RepID=A0A8J2ZXJ4_9BACL|nr:energy-coupling factor ABC transporter ATP-binding protein [Pullulanibacillus pueri]MBM7683108.1 energy-coupling factor transport system ATP-binding protein [Pullulanibacillus pueri]GGH85307.1 energy-coupling factor transporter ATP-binding protein EcfA2 [Pullulanibacillus pueri]
MEITVKHLTHIYQPNSPFERLALDDINVSIPFGKFITIIGHTGSGKSSFLQHLNGLLKPTKGEIIIGDHKIVADSKVKDLKSLRQRVGMVFQYPEHQLFEETVEKDIMFGPLNFGCTEDEARRRAREALEWVHLPESFLERSPFDLSGGQMRRVAIAGILAIRPEVLILDEPTAGLDPRGHREILDLFQWLNKEQGLTIIMVTHNMNDAALYSDEVMVMDKGRLVIKDRPEIVFSQRELLFDLGLDIPQTMHFLKRVSDKFGKDIVTPLFRLEETAHYVAQFLEKEKDGP